MIVLKIYTQKKNHEVENLGVKEEKNYRLALGNQRFQVRVQSLAIPAEVRFVQ